MCVRRFHSLDNPGRTAAAGGKRRRGKRTATSHDALQSAVDPTRTSVDRLAGRSASPSTSCVVLSLLSVAGTAASPLFVPASQLSGVVASPSHWHLAQVPHHQHPPLSSVPSSTSHTEAEHWLQSFRTLAREVKVDIAVGTIVERATDQKTGEELSKEVEVEDDETGEKKTEKRPILENVAYYVDWNGEILGRYTKRNLWWCVTLPSSFSLGCTSS